MTRLRPFLPLCWLSAALLSGCALFAPRLETPNISLVSLQMQQGEVFQQKFLVRLLVQNPNDRALPVKGLNYKVELMGEDFARGVSNREFTVPAFGEAEFDMTLTTNLAGTLFKLFSKMQGGPMPDEIEYRFTGKLSTDLGMLHSVPFTKTGKLPLAQLKGAVNTPK